MAEEITIVIGVDDSDTPKIKAASEDIDDLEQSTRSAGEASGEMSNQGRGASRSTAGMGKSASGASTAMAGLAAGAAAAAAAIVGLVAVSVKGAKAFDELDQQQRGLERQLRRTGASGEPLREELDAIEESVMAVSSRTRVGRGELREMSQSFLQMSGSASISEDELSLIADISEEMGVSGEQAARVMAQAQEGELQPRLARTTALTEDQINAINSISDESERAAAANELLAGTFGGAAEDAGPLFIAISNVQEALGDVFEIIGEVVTGVEGFQIITELATDTLFGLEDTVDANSGAIQDWITNALLVGVEVITEVIQRLQPFSLAIAMAEAAVMEAAAGIGMLVQAGRSFVRFTMAFRTAVVAGVIRVMDGVLAGAEAVASFFGRDLPDGVSNARESLQGMAQDMDEEVQRQIDEAGDGIDELVRKANAHESAFGRVGERTEEIRAGLEGAEGFMDRLGDSIEESRDSMEDMADEADRAGRDRESRVVVEEEVADVEEQDTQDQQLAAQVAQIRLAALREEDEVQRALLEAQAQELEIKGRGLQSDEEALELARLQRDLAGDLSDIEERQRAEERSIELAQMGLDLAHAEDEAERIRMEATRERMQLDGQQMSEREREIELLRIEQEERTQLQELERAHAEERAEATRSQLQGLNQQVQGLGTLGASFHDLSQQSWDFEEAQDAVIAATGALADVGGAGADMLTDSREKQAAVEGSFHAAAAIANTALAIANPALAGQYGAAAAQHALASGQFFAVASGAGSGGGAGGGGGSASSGGRPSPMTAGEMELGSQREPRRSVQNFDFSGATMLEDSQSISRRIRDASDSAEANRYSTGGRR